MYEELIKALRLAADKQRFGNYPTITISVETAYELAAAIETLIAQLADIQAENAELREENGCLQHNVAAMQATLDQQAKNCEVLLAEKDKLLLEITTKYETTVKIQTQITCLQKRAEAERDAAVEDLNAVLKIACDDGAGVCEFCAGNDENCHSDDPCWRGAQWEEGQDGR